MSQPFPPKMLRGLLTAAASLLLLSPSVPLRAQGEMDGTGDAATGTLDVAATNTSADDLAASTMAAATPVALAPVQYTGRIRQYPAATNGPMMDGAITLLLSPSGKVTGTITWSGTTVPVNVSGKFDVASGRGDLITRNASGAAAANAVRMPIHVTKNGLGIIGGGMASSGETTGFRLSRQTASTGSVAGGATLTLGGSVSLGGATLTLVGANTYTGSSTITSVQTLPIGSGSTAVNFGGTTTVGGTPILTGVGSLNIGGNLTSSISGTLAISSGYALTFDGDATVRVDTGGLAVVTPTAAGKLTFVSSTVGSASTVGGSGAVTISGSATAAVVGGATVSVNSGIATLTPIAGGTVTIFPGS